MAFTTRQTPKSLLGRHRIISPTAGAHVSPLCLGGMNFGDAWKDALGECSKETAFSMLDYFYSQGGNFIDTAVNYQFGESEEWIGEWMESRGRRDEIIVATKFTGSQTARLGDKVLQSNFAGNSAKNIYTSVERSLKRLKTEYIDLYYLHLWDFTTSIPEIMHTLNDLCTARKILYLGISDTPAWLVVKANCYARQHGLRPFVVYQGRWSAADRDMEREIVPMCLSEGMAIAPWGVLGGGAFKSREARQDPKEKGRSFAVDKTEKETRVSEVLEGIAGKKNTLITSVALAYIMCKAPYTFPIVGGRKVSHLEGNIEALGLPLTPEEIDEIDKAYGFETGFPHNFINRTNKMVVGPQDCVHMQNIAFYDYVANPKPIPPHQGPLDGLSKEIPQ